MSLTFANRPTITKFGFPMIKLDGGLNQYELFHRRVRKALGVKHGSGMAVNRNCPPGCVGTVVATGKRTVGVYTLKIVCTLPGFPHYSAGTNDRSLEMNQLIAEGRLTPEARELLPFRRTK